MSPFFLLFSMDYCEIYLKRRIFKFLLFAISTINLVLVWTTEYTHLIYKEFAFSDVATVRGLQIVPGPAYYVVFGLSILYIGASAIIIWNRMVRWDKALRLSLFLLMLGGVAPLLANIIYLLNSIVFKSNLSGINLTPFSIIIAYLLFYVNVLRYDLFDFSPRARSATLDMIRDGILFLDEQMHYTSSNEVAKSLFPELKRFGKGQPITALSSWPKELANLDITNEHLNIHFSIPTDNIEDTRVFNAWVNKVRSGDMTFGSVILIQDITDNIHLMKQLEDAAYTDGLTGIFNRRHFMELVLAQIERTRRAQAPSCVLLFDLDFFKNVNDTYGHLAGDEVLRFVAQKVKRTVRTYDIVARYGGEEFVVFLSDTDIETATQLAERIRENISAAPCVYEGIEIPITCSIGVTKVDENALVDDVLKRADQAMYQAKESGRNRVCVL
jgi:diguanylate cyclase (GGDEF)-like protein